MAVLLTATGASASSLAHWQSFVLVCGSDTACEGALGPHQAAERTRLYSSLGRCALPGLGENKSPFHPLRVFLSDGISSRAFLPVALLFPHQLVPRKPTAHPAHTPGVDSLPDLLCAPSGVLETLIRWLTDVSVHRSHPGKGLKWFKFRAAAVVHGTRFWKQWILKSFVGDKKFKKAPRSNIWDTQS